jgi:hypothetical protein
MGRPTGTTAYLRTEMDSVRQNKVNSLIQRELAEIFLRRPAPSFPVGSSRYRRYA